jgi:hypothetical protein
MSKFTVADSESCEQCGMFKILPVCWCNCQIYKCQNCCAGSLTPRHLMTGLFLLLSHSPHTSVFIRAIICMILDFVVTYVYTISVFWGLRIGITVIQFLWPCQRLWCYACYSVVSSVFIVWPSKCGTLVIFRKIF